MVCRLYQVRSKTPPEITVILSAQEERVEVRGKFILTQTLSLEGRGSLCRVAQGEVEFTLSYDIM